MLDVFSEVWRINANTVRRRFWLWMGLHDFIVERGANRVGVADLCRHEGRTGHAQSPQT